jgi:lysophospholipase L1-like esterase
MLGTALGRVAPQADIRMINAGISGHTTVNALERIDRDVLQYRPDLVTVMFGLNDMTRVPLDEYRRNLTTIVQRCRDVGAEVVLATPNNVISTESRPTEKLVRYCDVVREVSRALDVPVCDVYREFDALRHVEPLDWRLSMSDAIHPNMDGHQRIASALAQTITGARIALDDVPPPKPLTHTKARLAAGEKLRVLAMPPLDEVFRAALGKHSPAARVEVESWPVAGLSLAEIEASARQRVRRMKPDLVVVAVPRSAAASTDEQFAKSFSWIMNWSLNFGPPTWDCIVVHPSVTEPLEEPNARDPLVRRLVAAQDLPLLDRPEGDNAEPSVLVSRWLQQQLDD